MAARASQDLPSRIGGANRFDVVVIGGGHNGLVAAAYLARAGLTVAVLEGRDRLGGPCGTMEFLPGYRVSYTNSPGSLEPRVLEELDLAGFGLRFVKPEFTVVHHFPRGCFIGWRDQARVDAQLEALHPGEAERYKALIAELDRFGRALGVSIFEPPPLLADLAARMTTPAQKRMYQKIFHGSLSELLVDALGSDEARAMLGMVAMAGNLMPPSAPGTAIGLMLRPISLASAASADPDGTHDPRRSALRGSTGLAVGGMGAIIDALVACCRRHDVVLRTQTRVAKVLHRGGRATGVVTGDGEEFTADTVISAIDPHAAFRHLLDDAAVGAALRRTMAGTEIRGSAFKIVLALDGLPRFAGLPPDVDPAMAAATQFRLGASLDWIENSVLDALQGCPSRTPIVWGLIPSATSPGLAPQGRHLMSVNLFHAPYRLREGDWSTETSRYGDHCVRLLSEAMPDLPARIVDRRYFGPVEIEAELGLPRGNITHGDMLPDRLFGARPHFDLSAYRTPLSGFYLSGAGTWPGGYVTGAPGRNTAQAVLSDRCRTQT
jgi:phytoene dehydrogenase-like protein